MKTIMARGACGWQVATMIIIIPTLFVACVAICAGTPRQIWSLSGLTLVGRPVAWPSLDPPLPFPPSPACSRRSPFAQDGRAARMRAQSSSAARAQVAIVCLRACARSAASAPPLSCASTRFRLPFDANVAIFVSSLHTWHGRSGGGRRGAGRTDRGPRARSVGVLSVLFVLGLHALRSASARAIGAF